MSAASVNVSNPRHALTQKKIRFTRLSPLDHGETGSLDNVSSDFPHASCLVARIFFKELDNR
jgi:hypothetical protein